jgi:hypothetical protein
MKDCKNNYECTDFFLHTEYELVKFGWIKFLLFVGMYYSFGIYGGYGAANSVKMDMYGLNITSYIVSGGQKITIPNSHRRKLLSSQLNKCKSTDLCFILEKNGNSYTEMSKVKDYIVLYMNVVNNSRYDEILEITNLLDDNFNDENAKFKSHLRNTIINAIASLTVILLANFYFTGGILPGVVQLVFIYTSPQSVKCISKFRSVIYYNKINPYKTMYRKKYCDFIFNYGIIYILFMIFSTIIIYLDGLSINDLIYVLVSFICFCFYFIPWSIYFLPMYLKKYR